MPHVLAGGPDGKRPLRIVVLMDNNNIKMDHKKTGGLELGTCGLVNTISGRINIGF
jgi:hypothetical protein